MLSDPNSDLIRAYGVLNSEAANEFKGMARPGYFFIDPSGTIREKFFEAKYRQRLSGNSVIAKMFPELGEEVTAKVDAPHLQLAMSQSDTAEVPGGIVTLTAEVTLPEDVHVYAPGVRGYRPIRLVLDPQPDLDLRPAVYPRSKNLYLPAIKERVPVFEATFRIRQQVKISSASTFSNSLGATGKVFTIRGKLEYQACDATICYLPTSVPVEWRLQVSPLDRIRAPEDIRHK